MGQTTSQNTTNHKNKPKSISKLFHAQTGSIWFQIGSYLVPIVYIGTAQLKKVLGWAWNRTSKKALDSICRGSVLDPCAKETYLKRGQKVDPLQKWSSLEGPVWSVYFKQKLIWPATAATRILNWEGQFLRACFFLRCEDQKKGPFFVILARGLWQERLLAAW